MGSLSKEELEEKLATYVGRETEEPQIALDAVNEAMIRHWCEALGDENPVYTDAAAAAESVHGGMVAPPTMMQAWILDGIPMATPETQQMNMIREIHKLLTDNGYSGVVATNSEQGYARYLRPGDRIATTTVIESVSDEKATALGIGYFINTKETFRDHNGEEVGWQTFRVLKFKPAEQPQAAAPADSSGAPPKPKRLRPPLGHDNGWWWEGVNDGKLLIQKCKDCGELRHPPRPMCGNCQSIEWDSVSSSGRGTVYTFTVMQYPKFPGYEYPFVCALIELEEGTRVISNVVGCEAADVSIGMKVELSIENVDEDLKLPLFRPVA